MRGGHIYNKMTYIYLVENCFNDPNKVYIGKTISSRKYKHQKRFGNNITYTIIDYVDSFDCENWKSIESMWIQIFKSWGFEIMNAQINGGSGLSKVTESTRLKMSEAKKGKPKPEGFGEKQSLILKGKSHPTRKGKIPDGVMKAWDVNRGKESKLKGRKMSEDSKIKKSEKMKQYWLNKKNKSI